MSTRSIREWPTTLRPRERLDRLTPHALSDIELLAILVETGYSPPGDLPARSAIDVAGDVLDRFAGPEGGSSLRRLMSSSVRELCAVPGIGPAKATRILAALDLGRRAVEEKREDRPRIRSATDVYELMRLTLRDLHHEEFHILLLSTQNEVIRRMLVTRGTLDASLIHPREVFRPAIRESAAGVILVHNHPSGDPTPSPDDRDVTRQLRGAGRIIGIDVIDHVIIGERRYVSFSESGLLG